jgi:hypothetical protein
MLETLTARREDGTLAAVVNGLPYHITPSDRYWPEAAAMALEMGDTLPIEQPPAPPPPAPPAPTKAELMAQLQALAAQIAALPE